MFIRNYTTLYAIIIASLFCYITELNGMWHTPVTQHLWSYKHKEGDAKPFRGGRTKRQENIKKRPKTKTLRYMNFEEMGKRKDQLVSFNDKFTAIKYVEKMLPLCNDLEEKGSLILELADLNFDYGNLKEAELRYKEFYTFYPGNKSVEYAHYKAILCGFNTILSPDRDQTKTKETLTLTTDFLKNNERFTTYRKEVFNVHRMCQKQLFDSEASVFQFYLNQNSFKAAQKRLEKLEKDFVELLHDAPAQIALLKQAFVDKQKTLGLAPTVQLETDNGVTFSAIKIAEEKTKQKEAGQLVATDKKHMVDRF